MKSDIKTTTKPKKNSNDKPARAPITGPTPRVVDVAVTAGSALWQNDDWAITPEGLVLRAAGVCIIPKARLPEVGTAALAFVKANPIGQTPFLQALHNALIILCPEQWPTGLVAPELA